MGRFMVMGSLMIGVVLVAGQRYFPDFTIMWFASLSHTAMLWREALIGALLVTAIVREYYDNGALRLLWGLAGAVLLWIGGLYFMNQPAFIFDALFMLSAGIYLLVAGLQRLPAEDEPMPLAHADLLWPGQGARHARRGAAAGIRALHAFRVWAGVWASLARVLAQTMLRSARWLRSALPIETRRELHDSSHILRLHEPPLRGRFT